MRIVGLSWVPSGSFYYLALTCESPMCWALLRAQGSQVQQRVRAPARVEPSSTQKTTCRARLGLPTTLSHGAKRDPALRHWIFVWILARPAPRRRNRGGLATRHSCVWSCHSALNQRCGTDPKTLISWLNKYFCLIIIINMCIWLFDIIFWWCMIYKICLIDMNVLC